MQGGDASENSVGEDLKSWHLQTLRTGLGLLCPLQPPRTPPVLHLEIEFLSQEDSSERSYFLDLSVRISKRHGALSEASFQDAPPSLFRTRDFSPDLFTSDMTELIKREGDALKMNTEQEKSISAVDDASEEKIPRPQLPSEEPSVENKLAGTDTSSLQHTTPDQESHVNVKSTPADVTESPSHDVSPLTMLPPQVPLISSHTDVPDTNNLMAAILGLDESEPPEPEAQASIIQQRLEQASRLRKDEASGLLETAAIAGFGYQVASEGEPYLSEPEQHSLPPTGFAKLEFPDGHFYMTTYAVILGRDMRAWKLAKRQAAIEAGVPLPQTRPQRSASLNDVPQTPGGKAIKVNGSASIPRSFVSESGGIIGEEDGHMDKENEKRRMKKGSKKSKSSDSGPSQIVRKHSMDLKDAASLQNQQADYVDPNVTARLNPAEHMGDPNFVPLIPVHPPTELEGGGKSISRQHVKIFYNFDHGRFEMEVLGRNGAFLNDHHFARGSVVPLNDRCDIQIGGVSFTFVLPNAPVDGERTEPSESISGRMSFTFEDSRGESIIASDMSDPEGYEFYDERQTPHYVNGFEDEIEDEEDSTEQSVERSSEEDEDEEEQPKPVFTKPRRGRPRKNPVQELHSSRKGPKNAASRSAKDTGHPKIKINMSKRQKARFEIEQLRQHKQARLQAEKEAAKKKAAKARRESMKEDGNGVRISPKQSSKEASNTPAGGAANDDQSKPVRLARDEAMENGKDFFDPKLPPGFVVPPRKRGPGRPPKDGVMSKREKALLLRQAKEEEKARKLGLDPSQLPPPELKPTRVSARRNSKGEVVEDAAENGEHAKTSRPPKPPKSPSPEIRIEDYTEEQLQRPNANYVILIYEAIKASKTGKMNLQQIYSAIERRYPYFKFKTTSAGWQSSVRHNLSQHDAFVQVEKDGKGWLWGIKEGVPIERERRKKTPPPQLPPTQSRYPQQPYPYNGYPGGVNRPSGPSVSYQPPRYFPPSNTQSTEAKSQSYSSPYATDKPGKGSQPANTSTPNQPRPSFVPPSYSRPPSHAPPHISSTNSSLPQNAQQGPQLTKLTGYRNYRPSPEVVATFRNVFVKSYETKTKTGDALSMVNRAIQRVLHPETMEGVISGPEEMQVALAFENCIAKSLGPPRFTVPVGLDRQESPNAAVSVASTAAITAAASAGAAPERSTTPTQPAPAAATAQSQASVQQQRPAEASLLNLLTGARPSPSVASPQPASSTVDNESSANAVDVAKVNGIAKMLEQPHLNGAGATTASPGKPDVEPLTPPAPSLTPQPGTKRAAPDDDDGDEDAKRAKVE